MLIFTIISFYCVFFGYFLGRHKAQSKEFTNYLKVAEEVRELWRDIHQRDKNNE